MNTKKSMSSIVFATALLGAILVNTMGQARADIFTDLNNMVIRELNIEPNIGSLVVNFYVYSDSAKTGDLQLWIKFRDWSQYKTINYATAKKYIGKHDGESYALAQFKFPKATRNLVLDLFTACVKTVKTGEQVCQMYPQPKTGPAKVYLEAYTGY